jgi:SAM-dependent methyltransferase
MGPYHAQRSLAQLANSIPPEPQLYEALWRRSAPRRFSGGAIDLTAELRELHEAVEPERGQLVVDLGCSEGLYGRSLAAAGSIVLAVDHSRGFLQQARRRARRNQVSLWPVRALAQYLPLADASINAAVIGGSLNEIGDRAAALKEARRVLTTDGRLFSTSLVPAQGSAGQTFQRSLGVTGIQFPNLAETEQLFESAGFTIDDTRVHGILLRIRAHAAVKPTA